MPPAAPAASCRTAFANLGVTRPAKSRSPVLEFFIPEGCTMAEHEHGTMNTDVQEKTFDGFMSFVTRSVIVILFVLVVLAVFFR